MSVYDIVNQCNYDHQTRGFLANEATAVVSKYNGLRPKIAKISIENRQYNVLSLEGIIPVPYKGSVYQIPVGIAFYNSYPQVKPFARVRPTETMVIKANQYVKEDGTVLLGLLQNWTPRNNAFELIDHMIRAFSNFMPVFNRGSQSNQRASERPAPAHSTPANQVSKIQPIYTQHLKDLQTEIQELESEKALLKNLAAEVTTRLESENRAEEYQARIASLEETKTGLEDWIRHSDEIDLATLTPENLVEFKDLGKKQLVLLEARIGSYEDAAKVMIEAFNRGKIDLKEMIKGTKTAFNQLYIAKKLRDKTMYVLSYKP